MIDAHTAARLQRIGLTPALRTHIDNLPGPPGAPFLRRVVEVQRDALILHDGEREWAARALPSVLADPTQTLAVGDWVHARCDRYGQWWAALRVPPLSQLARRLHDGRDKVTRVAIVSNVDTALLVMGLDQDFNLRRLERYLALARLNGLQAVVVLTKADLCVPAFAEARLREVFDLLPRDAEAMALNALGEEPAAALAPWLQEGRTLVTLGSSGAGKSSLTNALLGEPRQHTGAGRARDGRGRHTTTARSLHVLPGGACVIDTPGLRTLRLDADADTLQDVFDDIAQLSLHCRFRDCRHLDEPGCAVRDAAPAGRLRNFHKLQRELRRDAMSALERKAQRDVWKVRHKASRARARLDREPR
jgi:ribosome biogenesis GTPase